MTWHLNTIALKEDWPIPITPRFHIKRYISISILSTEHGTETAYVVIYFTTTVELFSQ